jgi:hypothetical protein
MKRLAQKSVHFFVGRCSSTQITTTTTCPRRFPLSLASERNPQNVEQSDDMSVSKVASPFISLSHQMLLAGQEGNGKETTSRGRSSTCDGTLKTTRHHQQSQKQSNNIKSTTTRAKRKMVTGQVKSPTTATKKRKTSKIQ